MRNLFLNCCILLPALALAAGAVASEKSRSAPAAKPHAASSETKFRVPGGHSAVAPKSAHAPKANSGKGSPIEASSARIERLTKIMGMNARPAQPINRRLLISGK